MPTKLFDNMECIKQLCAVRKIEIFLFFERLIQSAIKNIAELIVGKRARVCF